MTTFGRTSPAAPAEHDLSVVTTLLAEFSRAANRDDGHGVVAAGLRLAQAGGFRGLQDLLERRSRAGKDELYRQWHWLVTVIGQAARRDDTVTVASALLFMNMWRTQVTPGSTPGDLDEIGFPPPPDRVQVELASLAVAFLADQDPGRILTRGPTAAIPVAYVLDVAAERLDTLARAGLEVSPTILMVARRIPR